ncbi:MAG: hypothetical protein ACI9F9_000335 [Candidatus Paceibacteria bacterium]|jgi:hypothetical protein
MPSSTKPLRPSADLRRDLLEHSLYTRVDSLPRLRVFMESHAFAVWDFMSLLKRLQADLCPSTYPWTPPVDIQSARFINEIVLGEESDLDPNGDPAGHLDIYLRAMDEVGADASGFRSFLAMVSLGRSVPDALNGVRVRKPVRDFVETTMDVALNGSTVEVAAAFLYGREDPIPSMFSHILKVLKDEGLEARLFQYYLQRHIDLDGDSHGPMGERLLARLIGGDPERERLAEATASRVITARIKLWSGLELELGQLEGEGYRRMMGI